MFSRTVVPSVCKWARQPRSTIPRWYQQNHQFAYLKAAGLSHAMGLPPIVPLGYWQRLAKSHPHGIHLFNGVERLLEIVLESRLRDCLGWVLDLVECRAAR